MNTAFRITLKLFLFNLALADQFMIYVRPLEKFCTVENKLIETSLIGDSLIEQWSLASLEMCISACFMRRAGIPCESVVFDSQQDHNCKLLDSSFFQTSSAHHGSSPQSDLYVIHSCDKDNNRIGEQAAVADDQQNENLVISTQMQLEITQESCTVFFLKERTAVGFSYFHQDLAHELNSCLALCRMTVEPSECIAVDYNSDNNQCVLLALNPHASPYARQHGSEFVIIENCKPLENDTAAAENAFQNNVQTDEVDRESSEGSNLQEFQQIGDNTEVEARMNLNVLQESCLVYFLREASVRGYSFFNQESSIDSLENCITLCRLADAQHFCTAVHFIADSKECTLLRVNPNADPYTRQLQSEFVVIGDCEPTNNAAALLPTAENENINNVNANDAAALLPTEENENINNVSENLSLIKSTVAIYQMLEECNGNYYKGAVIPGFHDVQKISQINSLPQCLHHCRVEALTETCDAVLFSKEEKKCTLFERNDDLAANKTAQEIFIELTDCHDDRSEERKHNPAPMKYYFPEEKEICLIEFYVQRTISSWSQINELQNVTSMRTCMEECRSKQQSHGEKCAAFNINSDKKCRLFKKDSTAPLYTVMDGGIFGEILLCFPGNMVDLLSPD
ncbi:UvrABC system protein [Trichinella spiralis]|uniref:UvrABC system protein n=1 Tax=Trichinella spiralis TaxID=6334 RepID=A0ABR3K8Z2_TRISP